LLLAQLDVEGFEALLQKWMAAQPGVTEAVDTLVCDRKTLRGSIVETAFGAARFIAQVSLYSNSLGVAIAQSSYTTDAGGEIEALGQLLHRVEHEGLLVQADALHANALFIYLEQRGADFLIPVKNSRRKGFQVIRDWLTYGRNTPLQIRKHERKRGRDLTWTLRGMPAPEWVAENWPGSATVHAVRCKGTRDGKAVDETVNKSPGNRSGGGMNMRLIVPQWICSPECHLAMA
jgi:hypothetical protein